jgi:hypothetical protein
MPTEPMHEGALMKEEWTVNHINTTNFGERKEIGNYSAFCVMGEKFGQNSQFFGMEVELFQYNYKGEVKIARLSGLNGVLTRMGQHKDKMKFHLTWPSCLKILEACREFEMISALKDKVVWREINEAIEVVIKNKP